MGVQPIPPFTGAAKTISAVDAQSTETKTFTSGDPPQVPRKLVRMTIAEIPPFKPGKASLAGTGV